MGQMRHVRHAIRWIMVHSLKIVLMRTDNPQLRANMLDESNMVVRSGNVVTAGAALAHMDLALWLIRGVGPELASLTARYLIVDSRPSQTAYALTDHLMHSDPVVQLFARWAPARLARRFSLDSAAKALGASKRTLTRRLQKVLGNKGVISEPL